MNDLIKTVNEFGFSYEKNCISLEYRLNSCEIYILYEGQLVDIYNKSYSYNDQSALGPP